MKTIDATPTWEAIMPILLTVLEGNATPTAKDVAREEIMRCAQIADEYIASTKGDIAKREII